MGQGMKMSNAQLNELLQRAIAELHDERPTLVTFHDPTTPLLPESYWQDQYDQAVARAQQTTADLFERSLDIAHVRARRRAEDERLADLPVDELLDDLPTLWRGERGSTWGQMTMRQSRGVIKAPTPGGQQATYPWECCQCSRPITDEGKDHAGRTRCDHATLDPAESGHRNHQAKPWHGEEVTVEDCDEEDDDEEDDDGEDDQ